MFLELAFPLALMTQAGPKRRSFEFDGLRTGQLFHALASAQMMSTITWFAKGRGPVGARFPEAAAAIVAPFRNFEIADLHQQRRLTAGSATIDAAIAVALHFFTEGACLAFGVNS